MFGVNPSWPLISLYVIGYFVVGMLVIYGLLKLKKFLVRYY